MFYGDKEISKVYYGGAEIAEIYHGSDLVYQAETPVAPFNPSFSWHTIPAGSAPYGFGIPKPLMMDDSVEFVYQRLTDNGTKASGEGVKKYSPSSSTPLESYAGVNVTGQPISETGIGSKYYSGWRQDEDYTVHVDITRVRTDTAEVIVDTVDITGVPSTVYWAGAADEYGTFCTYATLADGVLSFYKQDRTLIGTAAGAPAYNTNIIGGGGIFVFITGSGVIYTVTQSGVYKTGDLNTTVRQYYKAPSTLLFVVTDTGMCLTDGNGNKTWETAVSSTVKTIVGVDASSVYLFTRTGLGSSMELQIIRIDAETGAITGSADIPATIPGGASASAWNTINVASMSPYEIQTGEKIGFGFDIGSLDPEFSGAWMRITV